VPLMRFAGTARAMSGTGARALLLGKTGSIKPDGGANLVSYSAGTAANWLRTTNEPMMNRIFALLAGAAIVLGLLAIGRFPNWDQDQIVAGKSPLSLVVI
jgi:hypothetical protein